MNSSRRAARHFDEFHNPYRGDHPASYVPGGVAGYGYPVEERAPAPGMRERAEQLSDLAGVSRTRPGTSPPGSRSGRSRTGARRRSGKRGAPRGRHYGEAARREFTEHGSRYGALLGAIGLSLAAIAVGAVRSRRRGNPHRHPLRAKAMPGARAAMAALPPARTRSSPNCAIPIQLTKLPPRQRHRDGGRCRRYRASNPGRRAAPGKRAGAGQGAAETSEQQRVVGLFDLIIGSAKPSSFSVSSTGFWSTV